MKLSAADATRILSFCLDRRFELELAEQGRTCFVKISPLSRAAPARCFEADTFEEVLRVAAEAGVVRKECIERQIAFASSEPRAAERVPGVMPAHYLGLAELRYHMRRFDNLAEEAARSVGLETSQHEVLLAVAGLPPGKRATLPTLAERLCIDLPVCECLTAAVVNRGLARWTLNPADRREAMLVLTDAGRVALSRLTSMERLQILTLGPRLVQALGTILSSREE